MKEVMTVSELKKKLKDVSDDALVVIPGPDHSFVSAHVDHTTLIIEDGFHLSEDHGDKNLVDPSIDIRHECVVID